MSRFMTATASHHPRPKKRDDLRPFIEAFELTQGTPPKAGGSQKLAPLNKRRPHARYLWLRGCTPQRPRCACGAQRLVQYRRAHPYPLMVVAYPRSLTTFVTLPASRTK